MTMAVRPRALLLAVGGVIPLALLVQWSDAVVGGTMTAGPFPPLGAALFWGLLLLGNRLLSRGGRRTPLNRAELLVVLSAWIVANMVVGRGLVHPLLSTLAGETYYARSGLISRALTAHMPGWLAVTNRAAARDFYEGHHVRTPWSQWRAPLLTWAQLLAPLLLANLCLCGLFERVWIRYERLAYPLVALPMEALEHGTGATAAPAGFRAAFLFGLSVPVVLHGLGVAHAYVPMVPCISFYNDGSDLLAGPPWDAARPLYFNLYPLLIGLTFLAPTDVTLSVWFFLMLNKVELVLTAAVGWSDAVTGSAAAHPPYLEEQSAGAYLVLAALLIWSARRHLRQVGRDMLPAEFRQRLWRGQESVRADDRSTFRRERMDGQDNRQEQGTDGKQDENPSLRWLGWGFVLGCLGVLRWAVWTGMPLWFGAGFFGFYLVVALVLSRLMAEGGVSWVLAPILPDKLILSLVGSSAVSPLVITRLALHAQHLRDTRQMLAPAVFETGKLRDTAGYAPVRFYGLLLIVALLALGVGVTIALPTFYRYGALSLAPNSDGVMMSANVIPLTGINQASERLLHAVKPSPGTGVAVALGGAITWALAVLRTRYLGWPLHPLGYALTGTLQLGYANKMLVSIFLGWMFKALTLRFGGARGFRMMRGAALGLVLGDLLMGCLLKLLDALLGPSGYALF
jgi:hypothetical protein